MGEVDPSFIQDPERRPKPLAIEAKGIPLIDLSPLHSPDSNPNAVKTLVAEIGDACRSWGFFQVINHGVLPKFWERIELAGRKFFALPMEEKKKVSRDKLHPYGYHDTEHTKNVRDWKEVFDFVLRVPMVLPASPELDDQELEEYTNQWPEYPPEMREACEEYAVEMQKLAFKLMELISLSLGLARDRLSGFFKDETTTIRLNYYAVCPIPDLALGVGWHKDPGALTIVSQDEVGGLQVKSKTDEEWALVKPIPDAYIVNVGDIIQVWSNDEYESVEHRVRVNSERDRFSIPFFFNPSHYANIEPLEELVNEQNPAKYKPYNWGKFLTTRKRSNYEKLNVENIQIHHFKNF